MKTLLLVLLLVIVFVVVKRVMAGPSISPAEAEARATQVVSDAIAHSGNNEGPRQLSGPLVVVL